MIGMDDVLEIIEDRAFDAKEGMDDVTNVFSRNVQPPTTPLQYGSYSKALKGNPYGVMMKFLEAFYGKGAQANVQMGRLTHGYNGCVEGRPNQGYNGPERRNGGGIRDNRNGINQEGRWDTLKYSADERRVHALVVVRLGTWCENVAGCRRYGSMNHWVCDCPQAGRMQVFVQELWKRRAFYKDVQGAEKYL